MATGLLERSMRELRRHITVTHYLQPLSLQEVGPYIRHRLSKAGGNGSISFTEDACKYIYAASKGCPRIINRICDQSLLLLSTQSKTTVGRRVVNRALKNEIATPPMTQERRKLPPRIFYAIALILAAALIFCGLFFYLRPVPGVLHPNSRSGDTSDVGRKK
jgi:hypothetical protein